MKANSISAGLAFHARTTAIIWRRSFRRAWLWTGFLAFAMIAFGPRPAQAAVTEAWVQRYGSEAGSADYASKVVTDAAGNVIVAGTTVIKYSGAGVPLWTNRYNENVVNAATVDGSGNVFVTGSATIAYSGAGVALRTNRYVDSILSGARAVAVDGSGNVFVTGSSRGIGGSDYATIKYSGAGVPLWTNLYNGPANSADFAYALAVDASGNVFVTGASDSLSPGPFGSSYDFATVAYSGAGVRLWTKRYNGPANGDDEPRAVAVDASGNVFVTGKSQDGSGSLDYATIAYSGAGVALWTNRYSGPGDTGDIANAVAVDGSGNVFVTGYSAVGSGGHSDYATIAYSGAGVPLWTNRYNGPGNGDNVAIALAVDGSGNVFVTGNSATIAYPSAGVPLWTNGGGAAIAVDGSGNVFVTGSSATIAYSGAGVPLWTNGASGTAIAADGSGNVFVLGSSATIAYSGAGVPLWTNRFNGPGNGNDSPQTKSSLAIGSDGGVYVTGASDGPFSSDFATVKYVWRPEIAIQLLSSVPPKVNLTLSGAPNSFWAIERAPQLTGPWTNLSALLIGTNGSAQFQDTNPPSPTGFYRARQ